LPMTYEQTSLLFRVPIPGIHRRALLSFAKRLEKEVAGGRPFCGLITSDDELRRLNRQFRKHDHATDVLSFPSLHGDDSLGEVAISFPRAGYQATAYGVPLEQEVEILMLHGVLHLLGMDHETDQGQMARAESKWRARLGLPTGLIERVKV